MPASKTKATLQKSKDQLSRYKFDTSTYIILDSGVRRDATTGRLMMHPSHKKPAKEKHK
jgi:hypothetical protein